MKGAPEIVAPTEDAQTLIREAAKNAPNTVHGAPVIEVPTETVKELIRQATGALPTLDSSVLKGHVSRSKIKEDKEVASKNRPKGSK